MMKRIGAVCTALLLCLFMSLPCFAETPAESGETETVDVYARYIRDSDTHTAPVENGEASVPLADGTRVTVKGVTGNGLWLVVYPIPKTDEEAWGWFEGCMADYGTNIYPMDIYFIDQDGNRVEISRTVTVTVETVRDYADPIVCCLSAEGKATVMDRSMDGNRITFQTDHNSYYVLAEKKADSGSQNSGGTDDSTGSEANDVAGGINPKTGDAFNIWLWGTVMCGSMIILAGVTVGRKHKK